MATSVRLAPEIEQRLDRLASTTGRTKAFYLREIIERGIDDMEDVYLAQKVLEDVRAGRETTSSLDEVEKRLGLAN
ncbi:type II toxin-antitoxin system RelB family antitoxin [Pseudomonas sp.]|uniref:type II toxin-antitoxin system RelB family antitoxin n=1 Tax=Pseudomonas sp. TaxID=306 RepID=UPI003D0CB15B